MVAPVFLRDDPLDHGEQDAPVDRHEKPGNVELEHVSFPGMQIRDGTGEPLHSPDTEERALALAAGIGIVDERPFENGFELVHDEMVNDPVAEVPRENLALHGTLDDEGDARADRIRPISDVICEREQAGLVIDLEAQGVRGLALAAPAVEVGLEKILDEHGEKWKVTFSRFGASVGKPERVRSFQKSRDIKNSPGASRGNGTGEFPSS